jgi:hypothetical protein
LAASGRRAARCRMARWCLDCEIAVANEPTGCILLPLKMLKRKFWLRGFFWGQCLLDALWEYRFAPGKQYSFGETAPSASTEKPRQWNCGTHG